MGKLDKIRETADRQLENIQMTEAHKSAVHYRIAYSQSGSSRSGSRRVWAIAGGGLAAVMIIAAILIIPIKTVMNGTASSGNESAIEDIVTGDTAPDTPSDNGTSIKEEADELSGSMEKNVVLRVSALSGTESIITTDSSFKVSANEELSSEMLQQCLTMEPNLGYVLDHNSDGSYTLTPMSSFEEGTVVTLSFDSNDLHYAWAFQTESSLRVVSTLPSADSPSVPCNIGIEITFSSVISSGMENYFSISPSVNGKFIYTGRTVSFVPSQYLDPNTVYTVTVKSGLADGGGDVLSEDYVFSFRSENTYYSRENRLIFTNDQATANFVPGDPIFLPVYAGSNMKNRELDCKIYRVSGHDEYMRLAGMYYDELDAHIVSSSDIILPKDGLEYYLSASCTAQDRENTYNTSYIVLPELESGWYLAEFTVNVSGVSRTLQKLIQVSPLSVYSQSLHGEALIWVNDAASGSALSGANISLNGKTLETVTDSDGVAVFDYDVENNRCGVVLKKDSSIYADIIYFDGSFEPRQKYMSTIYTDRNEYLPNDTVHYWGTILPRNGAVMPSVLDVMMSFSGDPKKVGTVTVDSDGMFYGELDIVNGVSGYYFITFENDGESAASSYFLVSEYTKPSYVLDIKTDKEYYRKGEAINAVVSAAFFDGTPASGLEVYACGPGLDKYLTLDSDGKAAFSFVPYTYEEGWERREVYISVSTSDAEDASVSAACNTYVFPSDYMTTLKRGGSGELIIRSNAIDFKAYEKHQNDFRSSYDELRGNAAEISGTIYVTKCWYECIKTGSYYDFINKVTVPTYEYEYMEKLVYEESFDTENGVYVSTGFTPDGDERAWYSARVGYASPDDVYLCETIGISGYSVHPVFWGDSYFISTDDNELCVGETFRCELNNEGRKADNGRFLAAAVQDRIIDHSVSDDGTYSLEFSEQCIPNVIVCGAFFDGRHVFAANKAYLFYDSHERSLELELETDGEVFSPGSNVTGKLRVRDLAGEPVSSNYVIGVVDEAALAVNPQTVDPLSDIYQMYYFDVPRTYVSYVSDRPANYAEGGGDGGDGGSDGIRSEFLDITAFITGHTDKNGCAEFSFTVPDNLTSWRLTAVAVSKNGYAGTAKENIVVTQDFFMNLVMNKTYTGSDDVSFSARVYGAEAGADVDYTVEVDGSPAASLKGKSGDFAFFNLGKMTCGSHDILIKAKCGSMSDAILRTVDVKSSRLELRQTVSGSLKDGIDIDSSRYPVTLILSPDSDGTYLKALCRLLSSGSTRIDQVFGKKLAYDILLSFDPEAASYFDVTIPSSYQRYNGGLTLTPMSSSDPVTTAYALMTIPEYVDVNAAANYLQKTLVSSSSSEVEVCASLMGLAALREPVLKDVRSLERQVTDDESRYYLACAFALLGDTERASALYDELFHITRSDAYCFVNAGSAELNYELTARAAAVASILGNTDSTGLINYLLSEPSGYTSANFQLMNYIRRNSAPSSGAAFTCNYNGENLSVKLPGGGFKILEFNKDELENADFRVTSGDVSYTAIFVGSTDSLTESAGNLISISVSPAKSASVGQFVYLDVVVDFNNGCPGDIYSLDLALPSGLRFVKSTYRWDADYRLLREEDGKCSYVLHRSNHGKGKTVNQISFTIKTRAAIPGSFEFEAPIITGCDSALVHIGSASRITIK